MFIHITLEIDEEKGDIGDFLSELSENDLVKIFRIFPATEDFKDYIKKSVDKSQKNSKGDS